MTGFASGLPLLPHERQRQPFGPSVTLASPIGELRTVAASEAAHWLRYGWRYATHEECLAKGATNE